MTTLALFSTDHKFVRPRHTGQRQCRWSTKLQLRVQKCCLLHRVLLIFITIKLVKVPGLARTSLTQEPPNIARNCNQNGVRSHCPGWIWLRGHCGPRTGAFARLGTKPCGDRAEEDGAMPISQRLRFAGAGQGEPPRVQVQLRAEGPRQSDGKLAPDHRLYAFRRARVSDGCDRAGLGMAAVSHLVCVWVHHE